MPFLENLGGESSWDYSTNEVDTGQKWIDGSNIYCTVVDFSSNPQSLNGGTEVYFINILPSTNIKLINVEILYGGSNASGDWTGYAAVYSTYQPSTGKLGINSLHAITAYQIIVYYTKITT